MSININDMKLWGELLEIYRKLSNQTIKEFIFSSIVNKEICSRGTYTRIQNGEEVAYHYYNALFLNCDRALFIEPVKVDFSKLYYYFEYYEYDNALKETDVLMKIISEYKSYAYYDLMEKALVLVNNFLLNNNETTADDLKELMIYEKVLSTQLKDIVYYCAIALAKNITMDNYYEYCFELANRSDYLPNKMQLLTLYGKTKRYLDKHSLAEEMEKQIKDDNYLLKINFYALNYSTAVKLKYEEEICYQKFIKYYNQYEDKIPLYRKEIVIGNIVMQKMLMKQYSESLEMLKSVVYDAKRKKIQLTIFSLFIHRQLNIIPDKELFQLNTQKCQDIQDKLMIQYFYDLSKLNKGQKRKRLMEILEILDDTDNVYHFIVLEELKKNEK